MTETEQYEMQKLQAHADHLLERLKAAERKMAKIEEANFQLRAENEREQTSNKQLTAINAQMRQQLTEWEQAYKQEQAAHLDTKALLAAVPVGEKVEPRESIELFLIDDLLALLLYRCDHMGSQKALAEKLGVSESYLSDVLSKRRSPGGRILSALGYEAELTYRPIERVAEAHP